MSQEEVSRLINDVMSDQALQAEAMAVTDQQAMETFITSKGYELTDKEMADVWAMAAKIMAGHAAPMDEAEKRINDVKDKVRTLK